MARKITQGDIFSQIAAVNAAAAKDATDGTTEYSSARATLNQIAFAYLSGLEVDIDSLNKKGVGTVKMFGGHHLMPSKKEAQSILTALEIMVNGLDSHYDISELAPYMGTKSIKELITLYSIGNPHIDTLVYTDVYTVARKSRNRSIAITIGVTALVGAGIATAITVGGQRKRNDEDIDDIDDIDDLSDDMSDIDTSDISDIDVSDMNDVSIDTSFI